MSELPPGLLERLRNLFLPKKNGPETAGWRLRLSAHELVQRVVFEGGFAWAHGAHVIVTPGAESHPFAGAPGESFTPSGPLRVSYHVAGMPAREATILLDGLPSPCYGEFHLEIDPDKIRLSLRQETRFRRSSFQELYERRF